MSDRAIIVVTRFVVGGDEGLGDLNPTNKRRAQLAQGPGESYPSAEYVADRAQVLEGISAAALSKVTVPFDWVWLCCPERLEQVVEVSDRVMPKVTVVEQGGMAPDTLAPDSERFVTIRLDSDDALIPAAVDRLLEMDLEPNTLVNWWQGYQLNWNTGEVANKEWPLRLQGPFLAVTHESRNDMLNFGGPHTFAREGRKVLNVEGRQWVQTIHDRNQLSKWRPLSDDVLGWKQCGEVLRQFGIGAKAYA